MTSNEELVDREDSMKIHEAIELAFGYGGIDGAHHKMWVIDQMVRILAGSRYGEYVVSACLDEHGNEVYEWDTGIEP